jgi:putative nucleotidyltransferase with HDIG domain
MAEKSQTPSKKRSSAGGKGAASAPNGNGAHANGNGAHANGSGRFKRRPSANGGSNSNGNGARSGGAVAVEEVRRAATEMGSAMLVATSVETAHHSDDVELITKAIAEKLGLSEAERDDVLAGARLHDIGKTSVSSDILLKPGPLDADEWGVMHQHTIIGEQILASVNELRDIAKLVRHSHERWDGAGYPDGLVGDQIPLGSRIIFCADAFHAVRSDRPYRKGRPAKQALAEVSRCAGTQFDPDVVAALQAVVRDLRIVAPGGRARRSSRLTALLLILALGAGGSAVGRSDLLGTPAPAGPSSAPQVAAGNPLFEQVLEGQINALYGAVPGRPNSGDGPGEPRGGSPAGTRGIGVGPGGVPGNGRDRVGAGGVVGSGGGNSSPVGGGGSDGGSGTGGGGTGTGGGSGTGTGGGSGTGTGGGGGGTGTGGGGGTGGGSGVNPNANPNSWAGGGSPGQSGNAPGHGGSCPGSSCNPGQGNPGQNNP